MPWPFTLTHSPISTKVDWEKAWNFSGKSLHFLYFIACDAMAIHAHALINFYEGRLEEGIKFLR